MSKRSLESTTPCLLKVRLCQSEPCRSVGPWARMVAASLWGRRHMLLSWRWSPQRQRGTLEFLGELPLLCPVGPACTPGGETAVAARPDVFVHRHLIVGIVMLHAFFYVTKKSFVAFLMTTHSKIYKRNNSKSSEPRRTTLISISNNSLPKATVLADQYL